MATNNFLEVIKKKLADWKNENGVSSDKLVGMITLVAGADGTIKLNGTSAYSTTTFRAICFSEATTVTAIADNNTPAGDKDDYFTATTYTAAAGDILVAHNLLSLGSRFTSVELASGSAVIIL